LKKPAKEINQFVNIQITSILAEIFVRKRFSWLGYF